MNYIELINRFWELDEKWQFSCCETRLYFYLVKTANSLGWENNFNHGDNKTAANVGISKNSLKTARNRLYQAGLLSFKEGGKGYANKTRYQILTPKLQPKAEPKLQPKVEPLLNKLNQTKEENILKEFSFEVFWDLYDKKVGKKEKLCRKWDTLPADTRRKILEYLPLYKKSEPNKKYRKNPETFLNNEGWNDEIINCDYQNEESKKTYKVPQ